MTQITRKEMLKKIWGILPSIILIVLICLACLLALQIKSQSKALKAKQAAELKQKQEDVNVVTLTLAPAPIRDRISLPGIVEPWVRLNVVTEVHGKVLKKNVEEGQTVKEGDILVRLDAREYVNAHNSVKASYEAALATLTRLKKLQSGQLSTRSQVDDVRAQVENYRAALDTAKLNMERCAIKSPITGIVNFLPVEEGQYLNMSDRVAEILQLDQVKIKVGIPESDVDAVRKLTRFNVQIDALNNRIFEAEKHFLSSTADESARLYNLSLALKNPNGEILPDMFSRVEIIKTEVAESLSIPLYSVISRNNQNMVYVVENGIAKSKTVTLGIQEGWRVEVKQGLAPEDAVIVVGHRGVNDGQAVRVARAVTDMDDIVR